MNYPKEQPYKSKFKMSEMYTRQLLNIRFYDVWDKFKKHTVKEFCELDSSKMRRYKMYQRHKEAVDIICRLGHYNRRHSKNDRRKL